jgi:hypothetical protein
MFPAEGRGGGKRGGRGCGGHTNFTTTGGRNIRTPFANFVGCGRQGGLPPIHGERGRGSGVVPFMQQNMQRNTAPMYSNITKRYANWNVYFSCGFHVEDGHTSKTCPAPWRRANHQVGYNQNNLRQYIAARYNSCTKAMHNSQLPTMWWCGAKQVTHKCVKSLVSSPTLYPTKRIHRDDDDTTVVTSNVLTRCRVKGWQLETGCVVEDNF